MARNPTVPKPEAHHPPHYDLADAGALQALARGNADEHLQRRALEWIVNAAAGTYDLSFRPGTEGARSTDFAEGRRFVGLQIVKLLKLDLQQLKKADPNG